MRYKNETYRMTKKEQELFLTEQQAGGCPEENLLECVVICARYTNICRRTKR